METSEEIHCHSREDKSPTSTPTCYDVHAVSFCALFNDIIVGFVAGHRQEVHHHGCLLVVQAAQEVILLDGFDDQTGLAGGRR